MRAGGGRQRTDRAVLVVVAGVARAAVRRRARRVEAGLALPVVRARLPDPRADADCIAHGPQCDRCNEAQQSVGIKQRLTSARVLHSKRVAAPGRLRVCAGSWLAPRHIHICTETRPARLGVLIWDARKCRTDPCWRESMRPKAARSMARRTDFGPRVTIAEYSAHRPPPSPAVPRTSRCRPEGRAWAHTMRRKRRTRGGLAAGAGVRVDIAEALAAWRAHSARFGETVVLRACGDCTQTKE